MQVLAKLNLRPSVPLLILPLAAISFAMAGGACGDDGTAGSSSNSSSSSANTGGGDTSTSGTGGGTTGTGGSGTGGSGTGGTSGTGGSIDCGPGPSPQAPPLKLTQVAGGLSEPVFVTGAPGENRLFIVERAGRIKLLNGATVLPTPFLDIDSIVHSGSGDEEFGLLGLAFHPDYDQNGRFFVFYVANNGDSVLAEYARSANPDVANTTPVQTLLTISGDTTGQHFGGLLAFGKDGYLYVASGDRSENTGGQNAQNIMSPRGKILRFDVDNFPTPPPGNLPGGNPYVWDYGLRNPWRMSLDRCTNDLYIGDVGGAWEEVNIDPAGQGHKNFGWDIADTGVNCASGICPVVAHDHNSNDCSMIGGYVYRGSLIPELNGRYIYSDFCSRRIRSFVWSGSAVTLVEDLTDNLDSVNTLTKVPSFGEDMSGNLYVIDIGSGSNGRIFRIDPE